MDVFYDSLFPRSLLYGGREYNAWQEDRRLHSTVEAQRAEVKVEDEMKRKKLGGMSESVRVSVSRRGRGMNNKTKTRSQTHTPGANRPPFHLFLLLLPLPPLPNPPISPDIHRPNSIPRIALCSQFQFQFIRSGGCTSLPAQSTPRGFRPP